MLQSAKSAVPAPFAGATTWSVGGVPWQVVQLVVVVVDATPVMLTVSGVGVEFEVIVRHAPLSVTAAVGVQVTFTAPVLPAATVTDVAESVNPVVPEHGARFAVSDAAPVL